MRCVDEKFVTMWGSCNEAMGSPTCPASISGLPESTHAMVNGLLNLGVEAARYDLLALVAGQIILVLALAAQILPQNHLHKIVGAILTLLAPHFFVLLALMSPHAWSWLITAAGLAGEATGLGAGLRWGTNSSANSSS